jgi:hypothetical protein
MQSFITAARIPFELGPSTGRTEFQTERLMAIASKPNFDFFCMDYTSSSETWSWFACLYYTKDGSMHMEQIGLGRVIRHFTIDKFGMFKDGVE